MLIPLAHAGHWLPYAIPIAIVLAAVVVSSIRERRGREQRQGDGAEPPGESRSPDDR